MYLKKISVLNFRNIAEASPSLSPRLNCLVGLNGEGKTNFLDAVYYLSFCRSAFCPTDSQVMRHGSDFFLIEGDYEDENGKKEMVACSLKRGSKKHVKRNGKEYRRLSEHIGLLPLIFVSPDDMLLIGGGSEERRRLMDVVIAQYDRTYLESLNAYSGALQQRNALLKMETEPDPTLLDLWEEQMAQHGTVIYERREQFINDFADVFRQHYQTISDNREEVTLRYVSHGQRGDLLDVIRRDRAKDRIVGYSLHGIHRDDLEMQLGGYPLRREGSQGQNKTFVLSMKLAQFNFLRRTVSQTTPLLLLDDIFDKLDTRRVENIIGMVAGSGFGQIFITDTNRQHLDRILEANAEDYKLFGVKAGEITEI